MELNNKTTIMKRIIPLFIFLLITLITNPCTEGLIIADFTEDGRPIHWKLRMWTGTNRLIYWDNDINNDGVPDTDYDNNGIPDEYAFLGIRSNNNIHPNYENPMMGLNEAGFSIGISIVGSAKKSNTNPLMIHPLCHIESVSQFEEFINTCPGVYDDVTYSWSNFNNYGVMDKYGNCAEFEYEKKSEMECLWRKYDAADERRKNITIPNSDEINLFGIVVRANKFINRGLSGNLVEMKSELNKTGRYSDACINMAKLKDGKISVLKLLQGDSNNYETMSNAVLRRTLVSQPGTNCSSMIIQGVLPTESPLLTVFWAVMGHSDFSIAIPVWVNGVNHDENKLPPINTTTEIDTDNISYYADNLRIKEIYANRVQEHVLPTENKIYHEVNNLLLPYWRSLNWRENATKEIVGKQMNRYQNQTALDAYSLIRFLYLPHEVNESFYKLKYSYYSLFYKSLFEYADSILEIEKIEGLNITLQSKLFPGLEYYIDYGDGGETSDSLEHSYKEKGQYLISLTLKTDFDLSITFWKYAKV
jgi:hypothetical protein